MDIKTIEQIKQYGERLTYLDDKLKDIKEYAEKLSKGNIEVTFDIEFQNPDKKEDILDSYGSLINGREDILASMMKYGSYTTSNKTNYEEFSITLNESVALQMLEFMRNGITKERDSIIKKLNKLGITV